jgi:hypothetical protein
MVEVARPQFEIGRIHIFRTGRIGLFWHYELLLESTEPSRSVLGLLPFEIDALGVVREAAVEDAGKIDGID